MTKQVWSEAPTPDSEFGARMAVDEQTFEGSGETNVSTSQYIPMDEDFSDDDINAAARLAITVRPVILYNPAGIMWMTRGHSPMVLGHPTI